MSKSETIYVKPSCLGMITGKGRSMIKELSQDKVCRIDVKPSCLGMKTGKGRSMIKELSQDKGCRIRESENIVVQSSCSGMINSKGGSMIQDLSQQTIQIDDIDGDKTGVSLEGSSSSVDQAKSQITEITGRRRENGGDGSYGNNDRGNCDRGYGNDRNQDGEVIVYDKNNKKMESNRRVLC